MAAEEEKDDPFKRAEDLRLEGNALLAKGDFADASKRYQDGLLALVRCGGADEKRASEARLALHLNASLAELKRGNLASAVDHATGALAAEPGSAKALYRRGVARLRLAEHRDHDSETALARADLERALELEPGNAEVWNQLKTLRATERAEKKELNKSQRENFKGLFSSDRSLYEEPPPAEEPAPVLRDDGGSDHRVVLSADRLAFHYERSVPVLKELNLELRAGWCVGLVGNNAAGKTTLARLLLGSRLAPCSGRVVQHGGEADDDAAAATSPSQAGSTAISAIAAILVAAVAVLCAVVAGEKKFIKLPKRVEGWHWALLVACVVVVMLVIKLLLDRRGGSSARLKILHVSSEMQDKEEISQRKTIESVIGEKLPRRLHSDERQQRVISMLKAANFQMYNQETGQPVGKPEDYIREGLQFGQLSGGQKHLIYILRCFACRPQVLLCDELLGGLDAFRQPRVLHMLQRLKRETDVAVLYISCELHQIRLVADSLGFLSGGRVCELGPTMDVLDFPKHPATKDYVGQYRSLPGCQKIGGKLAESYTGMADDENLAGPWLPPAE